MRTIVALDYAEVSAKAAQVVARQVLLHPTSVLGLATGDTPVGMYEKLVQLFRHGLVTFAGATTFNLDEYRGLPADHPQAFARYLRDRFFDHVDVLPENLHLLDGLARDPEEECRRYEAGIAQHGGLDLVVLGLGPNGHVAFNEPASEWGFGTRPVRLSEDTRRRAAPRFGGLGHVPTHAVTLGIRAILGARKLLLLVCGEEKAQVLNAVLWGPVTPTVPGSILQLHPDLTVIVDEELVARVPMRQLDWDRLRRRCD
jgi:glucosamine-6-phosphate deaminase